MITDAARKADIRQLKDLWKEAFGDPDEFIESFFEMAYSPERCRYLMVDGQLAAALYWLDCHLEGEKLAYLYAVATAKAFQGRGLCRKLMDRTHRDLQAMAYAGAVLVPGSEDLFRMYGKMGYEVCSGVREWACKAGPEPAVMRKLSAAAYAALRRGFLPKGGVTQEGESITYLASYAQLWGSDDFCAALVQEGEHIYCAELLGDAELAPAILSALGAKTGRFRGPGTQKPFAMYHPLNGNRVPDYFGLAFD